jgi:Putative MetA-pathway of phenol degradation
LEHVPLKNGDLSWPRIFASASKAALFACFLACPLSLSAQWMGRQTGCYAPEIVANPNRPTVANPADITQYGVLEIESGWDRTSLGNGARLSDQVDLLKFGLLCDVELRWTTTPLLWAISRGGGQIGTGDNWIGPQIRFYHQSAHVPTLAIAYAVKAPTASTAKGFGSGRVDHSITLLESKDFAGFHFDFNESYFLIGRATAPGFDRNFQMNLAFSHPLKGHLLFTGEFYGDTELNASQPAFASTLWALTYAITPRLVIDGGIDVGLTHGANQKRVFVGVTYSIANLYAAIKRQRHGNKAHDTPATN